jgi:hypothetical protein
MENKLPQERAIVNEADEKRVQFWVLYICPIHETAQNCFLVSPVSIFIAPPRPAPPRTDVPPRGSSTDILDVCVVP